MTDFWFHPRIADGDIPAGITVSRQAKLPEDEFLVTEYRWGDVALWFVDDDEFTADERQAAFEALVRESKERTPH